MVEYNKTTFYLRARRCDGIIQLYYDSLVLLLVSKHCNTPTENIKFVETDDSDFINDEVFNISTTDYDILKSEDLPKSLLLCSFPLAYNHSSAIIYSGLTCALRLVVLFTQDSAVIELLGTSRKCFKACSEVSKWTRLCEESLPSIVFNCLKRRDLNGIESMNNSLERKPLCFKKDNLEINISEIDIHKNDQIFDAIIKDENDRKDGGMADVWRLMGHMEEYILRTVEQNRRVKKVAPYMEGRTFQLNDLVIFINFCFIFRHHHHHHYSHLLPSTQHCPFFCNWFSRVADRVSSDAFMMECFPFLRNLPELLEKFSPQSSSSENFNYVKSDPTTRPNPLLPIQSPLKESKEAPHDLENLICKVTLNQQDIYSSLLIPPSSLSPPSSLLSSSPSSSSSSLSSHPKLDEAFELIQCTMPPRRMDRKREQLSNMVQSVIQVTNLLSSHQHNNNHHHHHQQQQPTKSMTNHQNFTNNQKIPHFSNPPSTTSLHPTHPPPQSPSFHIVDFCAGSGHMGSLLCHLLPSSTITMVENKEESLIRCSENLKSFSKNLNFEMNSLMAPVTSSVVTCGLADEVPVSNINDGHVQTTTTTNPPTTTHPITSTNSIIYPSPSTSVNTTLIKSNLKNFQGHFDVAVCLHGCGLVTDLVLQQCYRVRGAFVVCPCCYGAIKSTPHISYPRSPFVRSCLSSSEYFSIAQASDRPQNVGGDDNDGDFSKGGKNYDGGDGVNYGGIHHDNLAKRCMNVVDTDRLLEARCHGYATFLSTMQPPTCSPKNNVLVGVPLERIGEWSKSY